MCRVGIDVTQKTHVELVGARGGGFEKDVIKILRGPCSPITILHLLEVFDKSLDRYQCEIVYPFRLLEVLSGDSVQRAVPVAVPENH
ncbi:hypothetical protein ES703_38580 [subsurface metagenome]